MMMMSSSAITATMMIGRHRPSNSHTYGAPLGGASSSSSSSFPAFLSPHPPRRLIWSPPLDCHPRPRRRLPSSSSSSSRSSRGRLGRGSPIDRSTARTTASAASYDDDSYATTNPSSSSSSSQDRAERHLMTAYPKFCNLLYANPIALDRMRRNSSSSGYAVFAPNDAAFDALGADRLSMLDVATSAYGEDGDRGAMASDMRDVVMAMAEYHMVSAPVTSDIMTKFGVVTTSMGEMNVDVDADGTMYVNGVRVLRSYQYEERSYIDYVDALGNSIGIEEVVSGGGDGRGDERCIIVHEVDGLVCPDMLWDVMYDVYCRYSSSSTSSS